MSKLTRQFQLLHVLVNIHADQGVPTPVIDFSTQDAVQDLPVTAHTTITVHSLENAFIVEQDEKSIRIENNPWELAYALLALVHRVAFKGMTNRIRFHAACADYRGARFIVIGEKGAGKTSLMLKLLQSRRGFRVFCDEMVLVKDMHAMPFPRRFHIKSGYEKLFSNLQATVEAAPKFETAPSRWLYGFSPAEAGYEWRIRNSPIEGIFFLRANHGAETVLRPCSGLKMMHNIMPHSYLSPTEDHLKISELCALVDGCATSELMLGDLNSAEDLIRERMTR